MGLWESCECRQIKHTPEKVLDRLVERPLLNKIYTVIPGDGKGLRFDCSGGLVNGAEFHWCAICKQYFWDDSIVIILYTESICFACFYSKASPVILYYRFLCANLEPLPSDVMLVIRDILDSIIKRNMILLGNKAVDRTISPLLHIYPHLTWNILEKIEINMLDSEMIHYYSFNTKRISHITVCYLMGDFLLDINNELDNRIVTYKSFIDLLPRLNQLLKEVFASREYKPYSTDRFQDIQ